VSTEITSAPTVVIEPRKGAVDLRLGDVWEYRELLYFLIWRDVKVRYKQTALGAAWAILQPFTTMVVFSLFFGKLAKMPSDGVPYPIFSLAALVPWTLFSYGLAQGSNSLVGAQNLIKKVYFPRLIIPLSAVLGGIVDFGIALLMLFGMMAWFGIWPGLTVLWVVPLSALAMVTSLAVGLWLSALNVEYRDIRYVVPFMTQLWMFATPIAYPSSLLDEPWRTVYGLNPMAGVIEGFRWALLGTDTKPGPIILVSIAACLIILIGGLIYFRRMERTFADVV
jgi:lipopolysaccharide transport system permease protein